jgi:2-polyprenyl-3-methyl-5-hydroxy-6-metoxy-1,4-benzoquinol methylase
MTASMLAGRPRGYGTCFQQAGDSLMSNFAQEVADRRRFEFGKNWQRFLATLDDGRIAQAERSLREMLNVDDLAGTSFLDVGSGSGLFSLAARRLGARVHSFDFDPQSVACTRELKNRFFAEDPQWTIDEGSALDHGYLASLGKFDVVYAWGVLHHTGQMWKALENVAVPVTPGGRLFLAIYNHQRYWTRLHTALKRTYVSLPVLLRWPMAAALIAFQATKRLVRYVTRLRNPVARYRDDKNSRGMSWWHDCLDWIGGYPFETATPEAIFDFFHQRGFVLERLTTCGGAPGCNQYVFRKALDRWTWSKHPYLLSVTPVPEQDGPPS